MISTLTTEETLGMPEASTAQSHSIQGRKGVSKATASEKKQLTRSTLGVASSPREEEIRPKAVRVWGSDKTGLPQESENHQEGRAAP